MALSLTRLLHSGLLPLVVLWTTAPFAVAQGGDDVTLPGTYPLTMEGDLAAQMVGGIKQFLLAETAGSVERRTAYWHRDYASAEAYSRSVDPNRERLRRIIGAVDPRPAGVRMELVGSPATPSLVAQGDGYTVHAVRWLALDGVHGEGLLLQPERDPVARVVALPDCDWTPEMLVGLAEGVEPVSQFARRLAESGCQVVVPVLIDRKDTWSGHPAVRMTNQPHREFVYRMAFEMGRHIIGYEVQKVLAAVGWLAAQEPQAPIGACGHGEGGLIGLHAAACDERIDAACVSGHFQAREELYQEPIYRNVFGLLEQFGDAEIAGLIAPRALVVEACRGPDVDGPPPPRDGRSGAAPGRLTTPAVEAVRSEVERARPVFEQLGAGECLHVAVSGEGQGPPGSDEALGAFLNGLANGGQPATLQPAGAPPTDARPGFDPSPRMKRQFEELCEYTQVLLRRSHRVRQQFWKGADKSSLERWQQTTQHYRDLMWDEVIGRFPPASVPATARTRLAYDQPKWRGYEVVLDVWPDVFAYGILLLPKDLSPGEKRPVVVCQHGLEGRPQNTIEGKGEGAYQGFSARLAERGFVVYAPQNPYIGGDDFRVLQRLANPLKKSLFAVIVRQHERTLEWLAEQPFVDADRIGFYGISYGGKTAMRVPALLPQYALSICSADFNEWVLKNAVWEEPFSYMFTGEYEMFEFDLGHTFNYAEMAYLIAPRPFMVERGHDDGVGEDEWVAHEYAKVRRLYAKLGIPERAEIEFFDGGHMIRGQGTFDFLHRHLNWPKPDEKAGD